MAVETKWFLVGVLILLASTRTNSLQISTISAPANLRTDLVVNYDTRLGLSNAENFNVTIRNWRTPRRVTFERDAFSIATFSRYGFYSRSNLFHIDKLGLQREHSPNEYSRSNFQQFRKVRKELPSDISRILLGSSFRSRVIVDQNLGRHVYQNEFKKFRLGEIRKNENIYLYDFHFVERVTKEYFHRFEREQKFVFRNDVNTLFRKFADIKASAKVAEGKDGEWSGIRKGVLRPSSVNVKPFLQYLSNWYAVTLSSIADISKYLVTIVVGLFCFDIIGPVPSMKQARKNELRNFVALYKWQGVY